MKYNMYVAEGQFNEKRPNNRYPPQLLTQLYPTMTEAIEAAKRVMAQGYVDLEGYKISTVTIEVS